MPIWGFRWPRAWGFCSTGCPSGLAMLEFFHHPHPTLITLPSPIYHHRGPHHARALVLDRARFDRPGWLSQQSEGQRAGLRLARTLWNNGSNGSSGTPHGRMIPDPIYGEWREPRLWYPCWPLHRITVAGTTIIDKAISTFELVPLGEQATKLPCSPCQRSYVCPVSSLRRKARSDSQCNNTEIGEREEGDPAWTVAPRDLVRQPNPTPTSRMHDLLVIPTTTSPPKQLDTFQHPHHRVSCLQDGDRSHFGIQLRRKKSKPWQDEPLDQSDTVPWETEMAPRSTSFMTGVH